MENYKRAQLMAVGPVIAVLRLTPSIALKFSSAATFSDCLHTFCTCSEEAEAKVQAQWPDSHS